LWFSFFPFLFFLFLSYHLKIWFKSNQTIS
jgi:hypothetical protein